MREPCPACHTIGQVKETTRGPGVKWQPCKRCAGSGFIGEADRPPPRPERDMTS